MRDLPPLLTNTPLTPDDAGQLAAAVRAVADPARLQILNLLYPHPGGLPVVELQERLGRLAQPTVSHHMRILREAGLVTVARDRQYAIHSLNREAVRRLADVLRPGGRR